MATSGTYVSAFPNHDFAAEAFERIGIKPSAITGDHVDSMVRSSNLIFSAWSTRGFKQYKVEKFTFDSANGFASGASSVTLNPRVIRVLTAMHRHDGSDTPLIPIGREEYEEINSKTTTGSKPDRFFLDRQRDAAIMYLYPVIDNSTDSLIITGFVATQSIGDLRDDADVPLIWWEAFAAELTARMAEKFAPERFEEKKTLAMTAFKDARGEDSDIGSITFSYSWRG